MGTDLKRLNEAVLTYTHNLCFEKKKKTKNNSFQLKIVIFAAEKNPSVLYERVKVMTNKMTTKPKT